jgi:hypothetical protein
MKTRTKVVLVLAAVALPLVAWQGYIEFRWSPCRVTAALLEQAPQGTSKDAVRTLIRDRGWGHGGRVGIEEQKNCLSVLLGRYQGPLGPGHVFAEWHFDDRDQLTDVEVYHAGY